MTASATDFDTISPVPATLTVAGVECTVRRIKMRELMLAARVLTAGMRDAMPSLDFSKMGEQDLAALLLTALPEAIDEFVDLLNALVVPPDQITEEALARLRVELNNPDPDTVMDLLPILVAQERDTFLALLGKFRQTLQLMTAPSRGAAKAKAKAALKKK